MKKIAAALAASSVLIAPVTAAAHASDRTGGLVAGFAHPLTGFDHFAAMFLVGIWLAMVYDSKGAPRAAVRAMAFLLAMVTGFGFGTSGMAIAAEPVILISLVALGTAIMLHLRSRFAIAVPILTIFGYAHGMAHGIDFAAFMTSPGTGAAAFAAGMIAASLALQAFGAACTRWLPPLLLRGTGAIGAGFGLALAAAG